MSPVYTWSRLAAASFLTDAEKRTAAGYGPPPAAAKFNPYHDDQGRFTFSPDGDGDGEEPIVPVAFEPRGPKPLPPPKPPEAPPQAPKPNSPSPPAQPGKTPSQPQGFDPANLPDKLEK